MYQPTEHQLSAFKVSTEDDSLFNVRELPISRLKVAIQYSIAKWQAIVNSLEAGSYVEECGRYATCGLCKYYNTHIPDDPCGHCPIGRGCADTPYTIFTEVHTPAKKLTAAKKEVKFLQDIYAQRYG